MNRLFTTTDTFNKAVVAINKASGRLADDIQVVLASGVYFAAKDGNTSAINAAVLAVGKGVRKTAIAQWLLAFAPVVPNDNAEAAKENPFKFSRDKLEKLSGEAKPTAEQALAYATGTLKNHWIDYKEPPLVPESWSLTAAIGKLVQQAKTYEGKGVKVTGNDLLGALAALVPTTSSNNTSDPMDLVGPAPL